MTSNSKAIRSKVKLAIETSIPHQIALSLAHVRSLVRFIQLSQLRGKVRNRSGRSPSAANDRSRDNLCELRRPFTWPRGHFRSQILPNRASKTTCLAAVNTVAQYIYTNAQTVTERKRPLTVFLRLVGTFLFDGVTHSSHWNPPNPLD